MRLELVIILLVLSSCLTIAYLQTRNSIDPLIPELKSITSYIQDLRSRYDAVSQQNASQSIQYSALQAEYDRLHRLYSMLEQNYTSLMLDNISDLQLEYDTLLDQYRALNDTMTSLSLEYSHLAASFTDINANYSQFQQDYSRLVNQINRHTEKTWPHGRELITPYDPLVETLVYNITGVDSNINDDTKLWQDIFQIYDWVTQNITYRNDGYYPALSLNTSSATFTTDMWQLPHQTIREKRGDCEDKAILLCSLLRNYLELANYSDQTMSVECMRVEEHVLCYIFIPDGQTCILDPTLGYYTQTGPKNDPQIGYKNVNPEVNTYLSMSGTDPVYYIFSDDIQQKFGNTQEFINWMNDRA